MGEIERNAHRLDAEALDDGGFGGHGGAGEAVGVEIGAEVGQDRAESVEGGG